MESLAALLVLCEGNPVSSCRATVVEQTIELRMPWPSCDVTVMNRISRVRVEETIYRHANKPPYNRRYIDNGLRKTIPMVGFPNKNGPKSAYKLYISGVYTNKTGNENRNETESPHRAVSLRYKYNNWCKASKLIAPPSTIKRRRIYWKVQQKISTKYFCVYINNLMCFWFLVWLQVVLNEIYQRKVELDINIKMLAPCQSALLLLRYFLSKVNIWIVNCAWATAFIFDTRTGVRQVGKVSRFFETENISTRGGLEHPTFGFMPNALTYWAIRARHLLSHVV